MHTQKFKRTRTELHSKEREAATMHNKMHMPKPSEASDHDSHDGNTS